MGNSCSSQQVESQVVDKLGHPVVEEDPSIQMAFAHGSKDLTEGTSVRDLTDSLRWEDFNSSLPIVSSRPFDQSLPSLAEDKPAHHARDSQSYTLQGSNEEAEFGCIQYAYNSLDNALKKRKPIFVVKVRIPGDVATGLRVLSHPLIVEAAETYFETVGISISSKEPTATSNRPPMKSSMSSTTIQILDQHGDSLVLEASGEKLSVGEVAKSIIQALNKVGTRAPLYLQMLEEEERIKEQINASGRFKILERTARFGVTDCDQGEVDMADVKGVVATRIGLYQGRRVLEVSYFGVTFAKLLRSIEAKSWENVHTVYFTTVDERVTAQMELGTVAPQVSVLKMNDTSSINFAAVHDSKKALRGTELRYVPMTNLQAMRANMLVHNGQFHKATHLLSPRQGALLMQSYSNVSLRKDVIDIPIDKAWGSIDSTYEANTSE